MFVSLFCSVGNAATRRNCWERAKERFEIWCAQKVEQRLGLTDSEAPARLRCFDSKLLAIGALAGAFRVLGGLLNWSGPCFADLVGLVSYDTCPGAILAARHAVRGNERLDVV